MASNRKRTFEIGDIVSINDYSYVTRFEDIRYSDGYVLLDGGEKAKMGTIPATDWLVVNIVSKRSVLPMDGIKQYSMEPREDWLRRIDSSRGLVLFHEVERVWVVINESACWDPEEYTTHRLRIAAFL